MELLVAANDNNRPIFFRRPLRLHYHPCRYRAERTARKWLSLPILSWIGQRAYFFYIFHGLFPAIAFNLAQREHRLYAAIDSVIFILSIIAMFAVAELSWRFFEKPLIDIGHRLRYDGMLGRAGHGLELG